MLMAAIPESKSTRQFCPASQWSPPSDFGYFDRKVPRAATAGNGMSKNLFGSLREHVSTG